MCVRVRVRVCVCVRACVCVCGCGVRKEERDPYIDVIFAVADADVVE